MRIRYERRRLADAVLALRMVPGMGERERWPREQLSRYQQRRLDELLAHAREHSPYYSTRLPKGRVRLEELPRIDKGRMMEHFDEIVCDPRLRRDELLRWVERLERDEVYLGRYRAMTSSGSSGHKGLFVFDRAEWQALVAVWFRIGMVTGARVRLPRRRRFAAVQGAGPSHMSRQLAASAALGIHRVLALPVTLPLEQLVEELCRFQPEGMNAYPSVAMRLAEEALAGRLRIRLDTLTTSSELRTPEMTRRLEQAFATPPFNVYATTEGLFGVDCDRHDGMHLFEDDTLVENVDADGSPVRPGEPGAKLLVTSLVKRVQPIIRLELPDVLVLDPEPCACGRSLIRARSIEGRSDDVLWLRDSAGRDVRVDPMQFGVITRDRDVREFQIVQTGQLIRIHVVPRGPITPGEIEERLGSAVRRRLAELGVHDPQIEILRRDALERSPTGRLQLVVADKGVANATPQW